MPEERRRAERLSRLLSLILRHRPDAFGLSLDPHGWVPVEDLLAAVRRQREWRDVSEHDLEAVARLPGRQRFELREGRIRARYGHSVAVQPEGTPCRPPRVAVPRHLAGPGCRGPVGGSPAGRPTVRPPVPHPASSSGGRPAAQRGAGGPHGPEPPGLRGRCGLLPGRARRVPGRLRPSRLPAGARHPAPGGYSRTGEKWTTVTQSSRVTGRP